LKPTQAALVAGGRQEVTVQREKYVLQLKEAIRKQFKKVCDIKKNVRETEYRANSNEYRIFMQQKLLPHLVKKYPYLVVPEC
jgi:hypothetical protein